MCFIVAHRSGWILRMSYDRDSSCRSGSRMSVPRFHMWLVAKLNSFWVPLAVAVVVVVVVVAVLVVCCLLFVVASCDRFQKSFLQTLRACSHTPKEHMWGTHKDAPLEQIPVSEDYGFFIHSCRVKVFQVKCAALMSENLIATVKVSTHNLEALLHPKGNCTLPRGTQWLGKIR